MKLFGQILTLFLTKQAVWKFLIAVLLGLMFSISVILATVGIMDGFDLTLKRALNRFTGDLRITSATGLFTFDQKLKTLLATHQAEQRTQVVQSEAFLLSSGAGGQRGQGVLLLGIDPDYFSVVGQLKRPMLVENQILVGSELAREHQLVIGSLVTLALAKGNKLFGDLPTLADFKVVGTISHGIYQQDSRAVYVARTTLVRLLDLAPTHINSLIVRFEQSGRPTTSQQFRQLEVRINRLVEEIGGTGLYRARPFWYDFSTLFDAVQVEKRVITIVLQLIVIIAIFNLLAFTLFLNEQYAKEIFLFQSLGLQRKTIFAVWLTLFVFVWAVACLGATALIALLQIFFEHYSAHLLPGDIYNLTSLSLSLTYKDFLLVFILTLAWMALFVLFLFGKMRRQTIIQGLKREFRS